MKHVKIILEKTNACKVSDEKCRECQTPCKSAAKTSNTIGNQICELLGEENPWIL